MYSEQTAHFHLPHYIASDIHNELTDDNTAYEIIDNALYEQGNAISENETKSAELEAKIDGTGGTVERLTTLESKADTFDSFIVSQNSKNAELETDIDGLTSDLHDTVSRVTGSETAISNLQSKTGTIESNIDSMQSELNNHGTRITALENAPSGKPTYDTTNETLVF